MGTTWAPRGCQSLCMTSGAAISGKGGNNVYKHVFAASFFSPTVPTISSFYLVCVGYLEPSTITFGPPKSGINIIWEPLYVRCLRLFGVYTKSAHDIFICNALEADTLIVYPIAWILRSFFFLIYLSSFRTTSDYATRLNELLRNVA